MSEKFLRIGDYIMLYSDTLNGYLTTTGYTNNTCHLLECSPPDLPNCPDMRKMIFQILPKLLYDNISEHRKVLDKISVADPTDVTAQDKSRLHALELRAKIEEEMNEKTIHSRIGEYLTYGQEIQLRHMSSSMLLKSKAESSEGDRSCFKAEVSDHGGSSVFFKILSKYKIRQEGNRVMVGDRVLLLNTKTEQFLHISEKPIEPERVVNPPVLMNIVEIAPLPLDYTKTLEVNISIVSSHWQLFRYANHIDDDRKLTGGEIIELHHTEYGGLIYSDGSDFTGDGLAEVYVRVFKGDDELEDKSALSLFIIENHVETDEQDFGNPCVWTHGTRQASYKLRHLLTGKLLIAIPQQGTTVLSLAKHHREILPVEYEELNSISSFTLESTTIEAENFIQDQSVIKVKKQEGGYLNTIQEEWDLGNSIIAPPDEQDQASSLAALLPLLDASVYKHSDDSELSTNRYKLLLKEKGSEVDAFIIKKTSTHEVREIEFIMASQHSLLNFANFCYSSVQPSRTLHVYVHRIIGKLILFLLDMPNGNPLKCEGSPIRRRQKWLRELGILDLICHLLYSPFKSNLYSLENLKKTDLMTRITQLSYRLLKHSVKDYRQNANHLSQWMGLFLQHLQIAPRSSNFRIEITLIEMLRNNKKLLENYIQEDIVAKFISMTKDIERHERFMKLLAVLCTCNGDSITSNQNLISDILIHEEDNRNSLIMPLRSEGDCILVYVVEYSEWISLEELYGESMNRDQLQVYNYFLSLLELLGELTRNRNHKADLLKDVYTLDMLYFCTSDTKVPYDIRAHMVRLMLNLHIDQGDVNKLTVPNYTRVWNEIDINQLPGIHHCMIPISPSLAEIKSWVINLLKTSSGLQMNIDNETTPFIREVLLLTNFMVTRGFYENDLQIESLITQLIKLLSAEEFQDKLNMRGSRHDGMGKKQLNKVVPVASNDIVRATKETSFDNGITIECKKIICQTLKYILDIKIDHHISIFLWELKKETCDVHEFDHVDESNQDAMKTQSFGKVIPIADDILDESTLHPLQLAPKNKDKMKFSKIENLQDLDYTSKQAELIDRNGFKLISNALSKLLLDFQRCSENSFVVNMLHLMMYKNSGLVNDAFDLLLIYFSQRKQLLTTLSSIQLLDNDQAASSLMKVRENLDLLNKASEDSENWLGKADPLDITKDSMMINPKSKDTFLKVRHDSVVSILKEFAEMCVKRPFQEKPDEESEPEIEHMDDDFNLSVMSKSSAKLESLILGNSKKTLFGFVEDLTELVDEYNGYEPCMFDVEESFNSENQLLFRNLKVYEPVIELIKQKGISSKSYSSARHFRVLRYCYIFLSKFCRNNPKNQDLLYDYIDDFLDDLTRNVFCVGLITEIFRDNLKLCIRAPISLFLAITKAINQTPVSMKKCQIIKCFTSFMKVNDTYIQNNQTEIMNCLSASTRTNIIKLFTTPEEILELSNLLKSASRNYMNSPNVRSLYDITLPDAIHYLISQLEIMTLSAEDKSAQAEQVCQTLLSLSHFKELVKISETIWPLKRALILFFLHVYVDVELSKKEDEVIIWELVEIMKTDLAHILNEYNNAAMQHRFKKYSYKLIDGSIGITEFSMNFVYTVLIPCLHEIFMIRGNHLPVDKKSHIIVEIIENVVKYDKLAYSPEYKQTTQHFLKLISEIEKLQKFAVKYESSISSSILGAELINQVLEQNQEQIISPMPTVISYEKGKAQEFKLIVSELNTNSSYIKSIEKEFKNLVKSFISGNSEAKRHNDVQNIKTYISPLVNLLQSDDIDLDKELIIKGLHILRKVIEIENKKNSTPAAEWDTDDWIDNANFIKIRQNIMGDLNVVKLIHKIFVKESHPCIMSECILISISMLLGGNKKIQDSFLEDFMEDAENELLNKIKSLLLSTFQKTRKEQSMYVKHKESKPIDPAAVLAEGSSFDQMAFIFDAKREEVEERHITPYQMLINILRLLQLLCEGHHLGLQNHLRVQTNGERILMKNFDFVTAISSMLGPYIKLLHNDNIELGFQILDTLTEVVQGPCNGNQRILSQPHIIDHGRDLLAGLKKKEELKDKGFDSVEKEENISELKSKTVNFLLSLLEGDVDKEILKRMTDALDFNGIKQRMSEVFYYFVEEELGIIDRIGLDIGIINSKLKKNSFEGRISEGFNLYCLMIKLADDYKPARKYVQKASFDDIQWLAFNFFKMHTGRIEVVMNTMLTRAYFPIQPICKYISESSKEDLLFSVNRESASKKVEDMLIRATDLIDEMQHNEKMSESILTITPKRIEDMRNLSMILTIINNYLMLFTFDHEGEDLSIPTYVKTLNLVSAIILIILNSLVLLGFFRIKSQLIIKTGWRAITDAQKEKELVTYLPSKEITKAQSYRILITRGPDAEEFHREGTRDFIHTSTKMIYFYETFKILYANGKFKYYCFYIIICGLCFNYSIAFSILLLDIIFRFPTLGNVLAAVLTNSNQILMTCMLGVILIYIFTYSGFLIDEDNFWDGFSSIYLDYKCHTLWEYFITNFNYGLRNGGGISDMILKPTYFDSSVYYKRFIFDLLFFIVILIIIYNIAIGIIIDTFAELREKRKALEDDMNTKCFICSIERYVFDKNSYGYSAHIKQDHNVWQYLYFLVHLKCKDPTEFNGIESYCAEQVINMYINWIPLNKAICLHEYEKNQEKVFGAAHFVKDKLEVMDGYIQELFEACKSIKKK